MKYSQDIIKLALERLPEWEREKEEKQKELKELDERIDKRVELKIPKKKSKAAKIKEIYLAVAKEYKLSPKQKLLMKHLLINTSNPIPNPELAEKLKLKPRNNHTSPVGALKKLVSITNAIIHTKPYFGNLYIISKKGSYQLGRKNKNMEKKKTENQKAELKK